MTVLMALLKTASTDENAPVKVLAADSFADIARLLKASGKSAVINSELVPLIKAATTEFSWRVRCYAP